MDISKCLIAIFAFLVSVCVTLPGNAEFQPATHNFSSYEVFVDENFCPGATPLFVDSLGHDRLLGIFAGYAVITHPDEAPYILTNVLVVAVDSTYKRGREISSVLWHECQHYRQSLAHSDYFAFKKAYQNERYAKRVEWQAHKVHEMRENITVAKLGDETSPRTGYLVSFQ
jgi:hypothetical protein